MRRKGRALLYIMICAVCAALSGCGGREEEIPMGRYADREVKLPSGTFGYMHECPDGSFYLYGLDTNLTYVDAQGESKEKDRGWERNANIHVKYEVGVSDNGAYVFAYTPKFWNDEELEALWLKSDTRYLYFYVDEEGEKHALEVHGEGYQKGTNLNTFAFSPEGELYAASENQMYRVDVESGEAESLFATSGQVESIVFADDEMLAADREKMYVYDRKEEKLLENNGILSEFIASHSAGGLVMAVSDKGAGDEAGNAQILYFACRTGLYRYIWGGSVIEQVADGQMTALGDTQRNPLALQVLDNGEFRVLFTGNYMVEMYYDETLPAKPSRELVVYSLEEVGWIRYAGQLFQKEHPGVLVRYEAGMDGDNAVSRMWEIDSTGLDKAGREAWQKNNTEFYEPNDIDMIDIGFNY